MHIINLVVKIGIIIIGILFLSGFIKSPNGDETLYTVLGIVFILFGIYRIVLYIMKVKQYDFLKSQEENDDEKI